MHRVRKARRRYTRVQACTKVFASSSPLQDLVSACTWLGTTVTMPWLGLSVVLPVLINFFVALFCAVLVRWPGPEQYDSRLRIRRRVSPSAFPCVELWACTTMVLQLLRAASGWRDILLLSVSMTALVVVKALSGAHFPSQLAASVGAGALGTALCNWAAHAAWGPKPLSTDVTIIVGAGAVASFIALLAYKAEEGTGPVMTIPPGEGM